MKHAVYEDPITHKFAVIRLPSMFREGHEVAIPVTSRWFETREEAVATLFDEDEEVAVGYSVQ